jgi:DHA1 family tetracycline resistance protein-like MFS transporter
LGAFFLVQIAGQALPSVWSFFCEERFGWGPDEIGYSLVVVGLLVALVQALLIGLSMRMLGTNRTLIAGFIFWPIGMLLFGLATEGWMLYVFLIPYCLGGIAGPALQGVISNRVEPDRQGELQGTLTSLMSLSAIISPPVMALVFSSFTSNSGGAYVPGAPFFLAAGIMVIAF